MSEIEDPRDSYLLKRFHKTAEIFTELYTQARALKPFLESGQIIEEVLESVSRLSQGYAIYIKSYLDQMHFAKFELNAGFDVVVDP